MNKYTAKFSFGEVTRKTKKVYLFAWASLRDGKPWDHGFSATRQLAESAARSSYSWITGRTMVNSRRRTPGYQLIIDRYEREHGRGSFLADVERKEKEFTIEIVEL